MQAIAGADRNTVERHGGLDALLYKIDQADQETTASAGAGLIDDFPSPCGVAPSTAIPGRKAPNYGRGGVGGYSALGSRI